MKTATLKEVAPASASRLKFLPDEIVWHLNLDQIESDTGRVLKKVTGLASVAGSSTQAFDNENVLYSKLRPYLNKVVCPANPGFATTELVPLRPDPERLDRQYLTRYLRSTHFVDWVSNQVAGAKMPRVSMKVFWEHRIPVPPLPEQKRIAGILDAADALRAKRRESLAQLDTLLQSTFLTLFGDPVTNPMGWVISTIGDIGHMGTGSTPSRQNKEFYGGQIPWVKSTEVDWTTITEVSEHVTADGVNAARLKTYQAGSIVLALYGQGKTRGKCAILGIDATINQACCTIRPNEQCHRLFLFHFLKMSYLRLRGEGRGGNQENLNMGIVRGFPIPLPPLDLQRRFAAIVESVERQKARNRAHLGELDALFASLQSRAFNGEL